MIKVERGELSTRNGEMPKKNKKRRSFLERAIEGIIGIGLAYLSGSATSFEFRFILFAVGLLVVIYALYPD